MRIRPWAVFLVGLLVAWPEASAFKFASWNLRNFLLENRYEEGQFLLEYPLPELRKREIRELILEVHPEVLFLQELGDIAFLKELQLDLKALGLDYPYFGFSGVPSASRGLAWLSQVPPLHSIFHHPVPLGEGPESIKRGIQELAFRINGDLLTFLHVHLKSRYSDDPGDPESQSFRSAELVALNEFATRLSRSASDMQVLLVGDFNTPFESPLINILRDFWSPVPALDLQGESWTYHHRRSGDKDRIDGFWLFKADCSLDCAATLLPASGPVPSDHRMVLLQMR